jgi:hypothetical protein
MRDDRFDAPSTKLGCLVTRAAIRHGDRAALDLWLAKTSAATKNEAFLGRVDLNVIIASADHADFGGEETMCSCSTNI